MTYTKIFTLIFTLILTGHMAFGQDRTADSTEIDKNLKFKYKQLIIPTVLITYGALGIKNDALKNWNLDIKDELNDHTDRKFSIDNFAQYTPALAVYGLDAFGVKANHNFKERTIILATSYLIMSTTVTGLKKTISEKRPDNSSDNSFPSGHTATAFMGAEFLWQEYKDVSVWYGITGYAIATGTGFLRLYNNRHWLTDVAAGAGIGMLSTKIAYWVNPFLTKKLFSKKGPKAATIFYPYYNGKQTGVGLALCF